MTDIVITAAKRTPVGSFLGAFAATPAHELGRIAIEAALAQAGVTGDEVSEVILGQVLTAGQGQNPARQASMAAGVPKEVPAWGVNQVCGSGLRAVALAAQAIADRRCHDRRRRRAGIACRCAPHAQNLRGGTKMGDAQPGRHDDQGRPDRRVQRLSHGHHRRESRRAISDHARRAGRVRGPLARTRPRRRAPRAGSRTRSRRSRSRAARATRSSTTTNISAPARRSRAMSGLRPAFKKDGTVTAANASRPQRRRRRAGGDEPRGSREARRADPRARSRAGRRPASIRRSWASARSPRRASALEKAGWTIADLDLIEANEAFAAQALSVGKELGWDADKVNVNGGAIAIGHPIGASGARVLTTLLYEMAQARREEGPGDACASAAAWASPCASSATDPTSALSGGRRSAAQHIRSNRLPRPVSSSYCDIPLSAAAAGRCIIDREPVALGELGRGVDVDRDQIHRHAADAPAARAPPMRAAPRIGKAAEIAVGIADVEDRDLGIGRRGPGRVIADRLARADACGAAGSAPRA